MPTVEIGSAPYEVYADVATADEYLEAQISATTWRAETDVNQKARALVSATRLIDRQSWQGERTDSYQVLDFPRTGLTYCDNDEAVPSETVPQEVVDATIELANVLLVDPTAAQETVNTDSLIQSLRAGSVSISYFRAAELGNRFPLIVQELLGCWLSSRTTGAEGSIATGVDGESAFEDRYVFTEGV
jgi:hypothetical protein